MLGLEPRALCRVYDRISILPTNLQQENKALVISMTASVRAWTWPEERSSGALSVPWLHTVDAQKVSIPPQADVIQQKVKSFGSFGTHGRTYMIWDKDVSSGKAPTPPQGT